MTVVIQPHTHSSHFPCERLPVPKKKEATHVVGREFVNLYVECPSPLLRLRLERGDGDKTSGWAVAAWGLFLVRRGAVLVGAAGLGVLRFRNAARQLAAWGNTTGSALSPLLYSARANPTREDFRVTRRPLFPTATLRSWTTYWPLL